MLPLPLPDGARVIDNTIYVEGKAYRVERRGMLVCLVPVGDTRHCMERGILVWDGVGWHIQRRKKK